MKWSEKHYLLREGLYPDDGTEAARWFRKATSIFANANAQYNLGLCYAKGGKGCAQDKSEAEKWFKKAAAKGHAEAQAALEKL